MNTLSDEQLKELEGLLPLCICIVGDTVDHERHQIIHAFPELLSTVRTLTRERDEARGELEQSKIKYEAACDTISRMQTERQHRDSCMVLSNLSSYLGQGLGDAGTSAEDYDKRIRAGIAEIVAVEAGRQNATLTAERDVLKEMLEDKIQTANLLLGMSKDGDWSEWKRLADRLLERPEALSNQSPWRDIATAPKDGTHFLASHTRTPAIVEQVWFNDKLSDYPWTNGIGSFLEGYFTHWMPLPQPPTEGGEEV
jgi:hypothetical protein